jgi:16S rRNA (guanine(966)-N(2))-methyltransferase RsmD
MRIITGRFKGRNLKTVKDLSVRPATDRVRQTIFNILANRMEFEGIRVLDLFAGSGSLGIEALSRGASSAVFVESGREAAAYLKENLQTCGCDAEAGVVREDARLYIEREERAYDLVFADPPYAYDGTSLLPERIFGRSLVSPGGFLLVEHHAGVGFTTTGLYRVGPVKQFGRTIVTFFQGVE